MPLTEFENVAALRARTGQEVAMSDWLTLTQERVDLFAEATGDHQWIHVDPQRAKRESPFGAPVAHGYLTLSLLAKFLVDSFLLKEARMGVNYGVNRVRFASPVRVGDRIRGRFTLAGVDDIQGGVQILWQAQVEIEGQAKPACIAELISRRYF